MLETLPKELNDLYIPWCENSPLVFKISLNLITGQCPFLFFTKFQIPWIWRWTITISNDKINIPTLERNCFYKWWNKMSLEDIQDKIVLKSHPRLRTKLTILKIKALKKSLWET